MIATDDLFSLIKSLSKNEKGYFKKYAQRYGVQDNRQYIKLFEAIDKQKNYDEEKLKKQPSGGGSEKIAAEKHYLYKLILRALNEYNRESNADQTLRELLNSVELLYAKTLYKQCLRLLNKAEKLAVRYEKFTVTLEIADWKFRVLTALGNMEELNDYIKEGRKQKEEAIEKYRNLSDLRLLEIKMFYLMKTVGYPRNKTEEEKYRVLMREPFLSSISKSKSYWAKFHYHNLFNYYYDAIGDKEKLYKVRKQLIEFAESDKEKIEDDMLRYLIALNNLANVQDELHKIQETKDTLNKIRSIKSRSVDVQVKVFVYSYAVELAANLMRGRFRECMELLPGAMEGMKRFKGKLHNEYVMDFRFNFFYTYFGKQNYSEALKWLNENLNDAYTESRREIYAVARILFLVVHYELGNETLLDYALKNARRYFTVHNQLFRFEDVMIRFFSRVATLNREKEIRQEFRNLKDSIALLKQDAYESQPFHQFDFESWVESKITGKKFSGVVQEKYNSISA